MKRWGIFYAATKRLTWSHRTVYAQDLQCVLGGESGNHAYVRLQAVCVETKKEAHAMALPQEGEILLGVMEL